MWRLQSGDCMRGPLTKTASMSPAAATSHEAMGFQHCRLPLKKTVLTAHLETFPVRKLCPLSCFISSLKQPISWMWPLRPRRSDASSEVPPLSSNDRDGSAFPGASCTVDRELLSSLPWRRHPGVGCNPTVVHEAICGLGWGR